MISLQIMALRMSSIKTTDLIQTKSSSVVPNYSHELLVVQGCSTIKKYHGLTMQTLMFLVSVLKLEL